MAIDKYVGSFVKNTGTGNQSITGVGFTPKVVIFFLSKNTAIGFGSDFSQTIGWAISSTERSVHTVYAPDNDTSGKSLGASNIDRCIILGTGISKPLVRSDEADLVSMDADGFTINWVVNAGNAEIIGFVALGGTDLTNVKAGYFPLITGTGNQSITGVGFQPDAVLFTGEFKSTTYPSGQGKGFNFGVGISSTSRFGLSGMGGRVGRSGEGGGYLKTTSCILGIKKAQQLEYDIDFVSQDADGFTINIVITKGSNVNVEYLALKTTNGEINIKEVIQPTVTGNQSITGVGFKPSLVMDFTRSKVSGTTGLLNTSIGVGASDGTNEVMVNTTSLDNASSTTNNDTYLSTTKIGTAVTPGITPTLDTDANIVSFDTDGYTINWTTVDATQRAHMFLAFGEAGAGVTTQQITIPTNLRIKLTQQNIIPTNLRIKLTQQNIIPTNLRIKLTQQNIISTNLKISGTQQITVPTNLRIKLTQQVVIPTNLKIKLTQQTVIPTNLRINVTQQNIISTNLKIKITQQNIIPTNLRIKLIQQTVIPTNLRINVIQQITTPTNLRINVTQQIIIPSNLRLTILNQITIPTNLKVRVSSNQLTVPTNLKIISQPQLTIPTNLRINIVQQSIIPTNLRINVIQQIVIPTNLRIAVLSQITVSTNLRVNVTQQTLIPTNLKIKVIGQQTIIPTNLKVAVLNQVIILTNLRIKASQQAFIPTNLKIKVTSQKIVSTNLRISILNQLIIPTNLRILASTQLLIASNIKIRVLNNQTIIPSNLKISALNQIIVPTNLRIKVSMQISTITNLRIKIVGQQITIPTNLKIAVLSQIVIPTNLKVNVSQQITIPTNLKIVLPYTAIIPTNLKVVIPKQITVSTNLRILIPPLFQIAIDDSDVGIVRKLLVQAGREAIQIHHDDIVPVFSFDSSNYFYTDFQDIMDFQHVRLTTDLDYSGTNYLQGSVVYHKEGKVILNQQLPSNTNEVMITYATRDGLSDEVIQLNIDMAKNYLQMELWKSTLNYSGSSTFEKMALWTVYSISTYYCILGLNSSNAIQSGYNYRIAEFEIQTKLWGEGMIAETLLNKYWDKSMKMINALKLFESNPNVPVYVVDRSNARTPYNRDPTIFHTMTSMEKVRSYDSRSKYAIIMKIWG